MLCFLENWLLSIRGSDWQGWTVTVSQVTSLLSAFFGFDSFAKFTHKIQPLVCVIITFCSAPLARNVTSLSEGKIMKSNIVPLRHLEAPAVQTEALYSLQASLGMNECRNVIERAVFELSDRLWLLQKALHDAEMKEVKRIARSLVAISAQIGLTEFSLVASDLADCIARGDIVSIGAVSARLIRVGERSLFLAVQFPEITG